MTYNSSKTIDISMKLSDDGQLSINASDVEYDFDFYLNQKSIVLKMTEVEANHYYNILSLVLTLGQKYWHNFCSCGGSDNMRLEFLDFVSDNIKMIDRDIKIENVIN